MRKKLPIFAEDAMWKFTQWRDQAVGLDLFLSLTLSSHSADTE
ncbi:hypothetical protein CDL12_08899 [Handroanthus impetiginosus]|uniref:Uncharacterized protein n=1 Tax=Handroanthus impetiginosus TaxID=429701 RepID=A0A2G9HLN4_9LAMI|nr:hypothetical protein CDL12_08899 [Handroanthus impetiginosus]